MWRKTLLCYTMIFSSYSMLSDSSPSNERLCNSMHTIKSKESEKFSLLDIDPISRISNIEAIIYDIVRYKKQNWSYLRNKYQALKSAIAEDIIYKIKSIDISTAQSVKNNLSLVDEFEEEFHKKHIRHSQLVRVLQNATNLLRSSKSSEKNVYDISLIGRILSQSKPSSENQMLYKEYIAQLENIKTNLMSSQKTINKVFNVTYRAYIIDEIISLLYVLHGTFLTHAKNGIDALLVNSDGAILGTDLFDRYGLPKKEILRIEEARGGSFTKSLYVVSVNHKKLDEMRQNNLKNNGHPTEPIYDELMIDGQAREDSSTKAMHKLSTSVKSLKAKKAIPLRDKFVPVLIVKEISPACGVLEQQALNMIKNDPLINKLTAKSKHALIGHHTPISLFPKFTFNENNIEIKIQSRSHYFTILHAASGSSIEDFIRAYCIDQNSDSNSKKYKHTVRAITQYGTTLGNFHQFTNLLNNKHISNNNGHSIDRSMSSNNTDSPIHEPSSTEIVYKIPSEMESCKRSDILNNPSTEVTQKPSQEIDFLNMSNEENLMPYTNIDLLYAYSHGDGHIGNIFYEHKKGKSNIFMIDLANMALSIDQHTTYLMKNFYVSMLFPERQNNASTNRICIIGDLNRFMRNIVYSFLIQDIEDKHLDIANLLANFYISYICTYPTTQQMLIYDVIQTELRAIHALWDKFVYNLYNNYGYAAIDIMRCQESPEYKMFRTYAITCIAAIINEIHVSYTKLRIKNIYGM